MTWPGLSAGEGYCGTDLCVRAGTRDVVHFHGEHAADVHLAAAMIAKLRPALKNSTALRLRPGSGWVTVRLETGADIDLLVTLVSAALLGASSLPDDEIDAVSGHRTDPCTRSRAYSYAP